MIKWPFLLCMALLTVSCNNILKSKPSGTLSQEQMTNILVDIHLTEAILRVANDSIARLNDTTDMRIRFAQVFRKNAVSPDDFSTSLDFYLEHIEELDKIYVEVINRLTEMEVKLLPEPINNFSSGQTSASLKNPWFRSLSRKDMHEEILYFDSLKYPVSKMNSVNQSDSLK